MTSFVHGMLGIANIVLSIFVLLFAIGFLRKTKRMKNRNPWIFLLIAVIIFFVIQTTKLLSVLGIIPLTGYSFYLNSMFVAILLFTFIFQYNLILNSELIEIKKKKNHAKKKAARKKRAKRR